MATKTARIEGFGERNYGLTKDTNGIDADCSTMALNNGLVQNLNGKESEKDKVRETPKMAEKRYAKELTACVQLQGTGKVTTAELMQAVVGLCGGLLACRVIGERTFELTMASAGGKERLMEGLKVGDVAVMAKELCDNEMVVSFLNLPAYISDEEVLEKLRIWGVSAVSNIRRRMWPGTNIADGTRFLKRTHRTVGKSSTASRVTL
ncbi:uncharacterized protein LOC127356965 [Dicentrarchus labrax]|uniref:uncharacterized protein LOC127356965 n=1 Tax=Dicentrarchus labrax TaxID=13489 RepID=UPI0021F581F0|nr:uncharacterized protein LOC127356965 [Dicentrarchus labrax]